MLKDFKFSYIASAKINIFLKIISKNKNFHNLVSLVGFTEFGDKFGNFCHISPSVTFSFFELFQQNVAQKNQFLIYN